MPPSSATKTSWSSGSDRSAPAVADAPALELRGVSLRFTTYSEKYYSLKRAFLNLFVNGGEGNPASHFWALDGIDLAVREGERVGVLGHNGAGKSTLLRVLARIYPPTTGAVAVRGRVVPLIEMGAGFNAELSGRDNIFLNGAMLGFSRAQMNERLDRIWDFSGLRDFADLPLKYYSSGMYTRLAFAVATEVRPEILLIDEALSAGDAAFVGRARERMADLIDQSSAVLIVSHDMGTLADLCQRGVLMEHGRIVADGPIRDVIDDYHHRVAAAAAAA